MSTFAIEFSAWRGVHREGGLIPELRIGWVTLWWCRGSLTNEVARLRLALSEAAHELKTKGNTR